MPDSRFQALAREDELAKLPPPPVRAVDGSPPLRPHAPRPAPLEPVLPCGLVGLGLTKETIFRVCVCVCVCLWCALFGCVGMQDNSRSDTKGSFDHGDPTTTNLYVGNLSPLMAEADLCRMFGKFGPLASVKIMWPRTAEEKSRGRMCGFVAFMLRKDGAACLEELRGSIVMDFEMKWVVRLPAPSLHPLPAPSLPIPRCHPPWPPLPPHPSSIHSPLPILPPPDPDPDAPALCTLPFPTAALREDHSCWLVGCPTIPSGSTHRLPLLS